MIPPLVAFLAAADAQRDRQALDQLLTVGPTSLDLASPAPERGHLARSFGHLARSSAPFSLDPLPLRPRALVPDRPPAGPISRVLDALSLEQLVPGFTSRPDATCVKAALYQLHDYLDASHELAQAADDDTGRHRTAAYWHGIMHRREPDYDNARYWFRRVGKHPAFEQIGREVQERLRDQQFADRVGFHRLIDRDGGWNAAAFVDLCERCGRTVDDRSGAAAELQMIEMRSLLEFTCRAALGSS